MDKKIKPEQTSTQADAQVDEQLAETPADQEDTANALPASEEETMPLLAEGEFDEVAEGTCTESAAQQVPHISNKAIAALVILIGAVVLALVFGAFALSQCVANTARTTEPTTSMTQTSPSEQSPAPGQTSNATAVEHEHVWETLAQEVHTDAVTHEENRDPTYENVTTPHTVCNVCLAVIDNEIDQHQQETGHYAWTPNVPITSEVMTDEGGPITIIDVPETTELVPTAEICTICGETRALEK